MAEAKELETLVYCLGPVGGQDNPVITKAPAVFSKDDYTTKGYARYIKEADNMIKFQNKVINYFMDSVRPEFEEDPLAFIDETNEEDMLASIQKMKKHWREMFKEHQKKLRESLKKQKEAIEEAESSSSAKIPRLDPAVAKEAASVEKVEFPESIFSRATKEFARVLKTEYQELRARMGKALDRVSKDEAIYDLKGFSFQNMEKFAKWKYGLKLLGHLLADLESKLGELDLDLDKIKENEDRITKWMYFDDGKKDRKYHHRLLITMELTVSVAEISAIVFKQIRRWKKLSRKLANQLPKESEAFEENVKQWKSEIVAHSPLKKIFAAQKSIESDDTLFGADEMPEET